jgi:hypothetical protein
MLLGLIHMALRHRRHAEVLGLVAPMLLASPLSAQLQKYRAETVDTALRRFDKMSIIGVSLASFAALIASVVAIQVGIANADQSFAPSAAIEFVRAHRISGPTFNDINFGDYLIFSGIPVFIDGRVDMYGDSFVEKYAAVEGFQKLVVQYGARWAILTPKNPHVPILDNLAEWRRVYTDPFAIVYERNPLACVWTCPGIVATGVAHSRNELPGPGLR